MPTYKSNSLGVEDQVEIMGPTHKHDIYQVPLIFSKGKK